MGICESTNNQKTTEQTNTQMATPINEVTTENKIGTTTANPTESNGFLGNIFGNNNQNTAPANTNNSNSNGILGGLLGSNSNQNTTNTNSNNSGLLNNLMGSSPNQNNTNSNGFLGNILGSNQNTTTTNTNNEGTATKIINLAVENKDTLIALGKKIAN